MKVSDPLGAIELDQAEESLIQMVQEDSFSFEILNFQGQKNVHPSSKLRKIKSMVKQ